MTNPRLFDNRLSQEWIGFTVLRRVTIAALVVHFSLAAAAGYRAIVQVYDVTIQLDSSLVRPGSLVAARLVTSGRNPVDARLELVQSAHSETIGTARVPMNQANFYDPRPHRFVLHAAIPSDVLSRFSPGKASIRAVAEGRSQFMRVPPPEVRERSIMLSGP